jgi:hypothetical protein
MGFDILGKAPRSKVGRSFGVNYSGWYDMADACHRVAPNICAKIDKVYWYTNDGHGLDDADAVRLADALDAAIERGALGYADAMSGQESAAERKLVLGLRLPDGRSVALAAPDLLPKGKPWLSDRLREFTAFLRASGGFEIW